MDVRPLRQPLLPPHKLLHYITFRRFEQPISRPAAPRRAFLTFPPPAFCIFHQKPPRSAHNPAFWQLLTHFLHFGPEFFCKDPHSPPFLAGTAGKPFHPFQQHGPDRSNTSRGFVHRPAKKSPSGPIKPHRGKMTEGTAKASGDAQHKARFPLSIDLRRPALPLRQSGSQQRKRRRRCRRAWQVGQAGSELLGRVAKQTARDHRF